MRSRANLERARNPAERSPWAHVLPRQLGRDGADLVDAIRHFGPLGKFRYGHFQATKGTVPAFTESFVDDADYDPIELIAALDESAPMASWSRATCRIDMDIDDGRSSRQENAVSPPIGRCRPRVHDRLPQGDDRCGSQEQGGSAMIHLRGITWAHTRGFAPWQRSGGSWRSFTPTRR